MVNYNMLVDLDKPASNTILVKKGDDKSRTILFTFISNGKRYKIGPDDIVSLRAVLPNESGNIFANCDITEDGKASYTLTENMLTVTGKIVAEVNIFTANGANINSFEFYINVEGTLYNEMDYLSDDDLSGVKDYVNKSRAAAESTKQYMETTEGYMNAAEETYEKTEDLKAFVEEVEPVLKSYAEQTQENADIATTQAGNASASAREAQNQAYTATERATLASESASSAVDTYNQTLGIKQDVLTTQAEINARISDAEGYASASKTNADAAEASASTAIINASAAQASATKAEADAKEVEEALKKLPKDVSGLIDNVDQLNKDLNGFAFKTEDGEKKVYNPTTEAWEDFGGGQGASTWDEVQNKPFSTIGANLSVDESGALNAEASSEGLIHITWAEYQALPEAEKNSKDYVVTDAPDEVTIAEVDEKLEDLASYSPNDIIIGKWVDGRNIHRRIYMLHDIASAFGEFLIDANFKCTDFDVLVDYKGYVRSGNGGTVRPLGTLTIADGQITSHNSASIVIRATGLFINLSQCTATEGCIILEYVTN